MKNLLFLFFMIAVFFSCEKDLAIDRSSAILGQKEIEYIGTSHNAIVTDVILEGKIFRSLSEIQTDVKLRVSDPGAINTEMNDQDLKAFAQGRVEIVLSKFSKHESYKWVKKILDVDFDLLTLQKAVAELNQIEKEAKASIIDSRELTSVLIALNVAKNSAELWMSKSQGGLELTKHIVKSQNSNHAELRDDDYGFYEDDMPLEEDPEYKPDPLKNTKIIVASDAVGAYTGFLQTAVLTAIPGANSAVAVNTIFQGATASVLAAISLW